MKNLDVCFVLLSTFLKITQAQQGAKYLGFFSSRSLKTREKDVSFAQLIYVFFDIIEK